MSRQHLDTAPVWAAYHADSECPLCQLEHKTERDYVEFFLGGSVMEPAVRMEVNQKGFCAAHFEMLYDAGNRLGVALMADTCLREAIARVRADESGTARPLFGRRAAPAPPLSKGCVLCERLDQTMARYAETLGWMWKNEAAFREAFEKSKGLCLKHYELLSADADKDFHASLMRVTLGGLERVERDLKWFTEKFDFRNQDKPWGESRDAVERALIKLRGGVARQTEE